jgi:hypothetical protein
MHEMRCDPAPGCNVLADILQDHAGFYFYSVQPITSSMESDNLVVATLSGKDRVISAQSVLSFLTELMLESNQKWNNLIQHGPLRFWPSVAQHKRASQSPTSPTMSQELVLALVKARARFLKRFGNKQADDVDDLLVAYTQHLLNKFERMGHETLHGQPVLWRLSQQDICRATRGVIILGPSKQISKNRYELSPTARNLLYPIEQISAIGKTKPDLMGLAAEIIYGRPLGQHTRRPL